MTRLPNAAGRLKFRDLVHSILCGWHRCARARRRTPFNQYRWAPLSQNRQCPCNGL